MAAPASTITDIRPYPPSPARMMQEEKECLCSAVPEMEPHSSSDSLLSSARSLLSSSKHHRARPSGSDSATLRAQLATAVSLVAALTKQVSQHAKHASELKSEYSQSITSALSSANTVAHDLQREQRARHRAQEKLRHARGELARALAASKKASMDAKHTAELSAEDITHSTQLMRARQSKWRGERAALVAELDQLRESFYSAKKELSSKESELLERESHLSSVCAESQSRATLAEERARQLDEARTHIDSLIEERRTLMAQLTDSRIEGTRLSMTADELSDSLQNLDDLRSQLTEARAELSRQSVQCESLTAENAAWRAKEADMTERARELESLTLRMQEKCLAVREEFEARAASERQLMLAEHARTVDSLAAERDGALSRCRDAHASHALTVSQLESLHGEWREARESQQRLVDSLQHSIQQLQQQLREKDREVEEIRAAGDETAQRAIIADTHSQSVTDTIERLRLQHARELERRNNQSEQLTQQLRQVKSECVLLQSECAALRAQCKRSETETRAKSTELLDLSATMSSSMISNDTHASVVLELDAARDEARALREKARHAEEERAVAETRATTAETALIATINEHSRVIDTQREAKRAAESQLHSAELQLRAEQHNTQSQQSRVSELEAELSALTGKLSLMSTEFAARESALESLLSSIRNDESELRRQQQHGHARQLCELTSQLNETRASQALAVTELQRARTDAEERRIAADVTKREVERQLSEAREQLDHAQRTAQEARDQWQQSERAASEAKHVAHKSELDADQLRAVIAELQRALEKRDHHATELESSLRARIAAMEDEAIRAALTHAKSLDVESESKLAAQSEHAAVELELADNRARNERLSSRVTTLESEARVLRTEAAEFQARAAKREAHLEELIDTLRANDIELRSHQQRAHSEQLTDLELKLTRARDESEAQSQQYRTENERKQAKLDALQAATLAVRDELSETRELLSQAQYHAQQAVTQHETASVELRTAREEADRVRQLLHSEQKRFTELVAEFEERLSLSQQREMTSRARISALTDSLTALELSLTTVSAKSVESELSHRGELISTLQAARAVQSELAASEAVNADLSRESIAELAAAADRERCVSLQHQLEIREARRAINLAELQHRSELIKHQSRIDELSAKHADTQQENQLLRATLRDAKIEFEAAVGRVEERHAETLKMAESLPSPTVDHSECLAAIAEKDALLRSVQREIDEIAADAGETRAPPSESSSSVASVAASLVNLRSRCLSVVAELDAEKSVSDSQQRTHDSKSKKLKRKIAETRLENEQLKASVSKAQEWEWEVKEEAMALPAPVSDSARVVRVSAARMPAVSLDPRTMALLKAEREVLEWRARHARLAASFAASERDWRDMLDRANTEHKSLKTSDSDSEAKEEDRLVTIEIQEWFQQYEGSGADTDAVKECEECKEQPEARALTHRRRPSTAPVVTLSGRGTVSSPSGQRSTRTPNSANANSSSRFTSRSSFHSSRRLGSSHGRDDEDDGEERRVPRYQDSRALAAELAFEDDEEERARAQSVSAPISAFASPQPRARSSLSKPLSPLPRSHATMDDALGNLRAVNSELSQRLSSMESAYDQLRQDRDALIADHSHAMERHTRETASALAEQMAAVRQLQQQLRHTQPQPQSFTAQPSMARNASSLDDLNVTRSSLSARSTRLAESLVHDSMSTPSGHRRFASVLDSPSYFARAAREAEADRAILQSRVRMLEAQIEHMTEAESVAHAEYEALRRSARLIEAENNDTKLRAKEMERLLHSSEDELSRVRVAFERGQQRVAELDAALASESEARQRLDAEFRDNLAHVESLQSELSEANARDEENIAIMKQLEAEVRDLDRELRQREQNEESLKTKLSDAAKQTQHDLSERKKAGRALERSQTQSQSLRKQLDDANTELARMQEQLQSQMMLLSSVQESSSAESTSLAASLVAAAEELESVSVVEEERRREIEAFSAIQAATIERLMQEKERAHDQPEEKENDSEHAAVEDSQPVDRLTAARLTLQRMREQQRRQREQQQQQSS